MTKDELYSMLELTLKQKGFVLKDDKGFLKLVKQSDIEDGSLLTKIIE